MTRSPYWKGVSQTTSAQGATAFEDPEDMRVLARVLDAQKTIEGGKRAIEILESLISKNLANAEDRFLLAHLYEISGDWPKARVAYRELNLRTKNTRDMEILNRRPAIPCAVRERSASKSQGKR